VYAHVQEAERSYLHLSYLLNGLPLQLLYTLVIHKIEEVRVLAREALVECARLELLKDPLQRFIHLQTCALNNQIHTAHRTPHTAHRTPHTAHRTPHTAHRTRTSLLRDLYDWSVLCMPLIRNRIWLVS
jgi:hypothetical protein